MVISNSARARLAVVEAVVMCAVAATIGIMLAYIATIGLLMYITSMTGPWGMVATVPVGLGAAVCMFLLMGVTMEIATSQPSRWLGIDLDHV